MLMLMLMLMPSAVSLFAALPFHITLDFYNVIFDKEVAKYEIIYFLLKVRICFPTLSITYVRSWIYLRFL